MSDFIPDRIAVTFKMTADDYARYFTVLSRHQSGRADLYAYIAALLGAIPVALLFRSIGARRLADSAAVELIGQFSLAAFLLGTVAIVVAALVARRIAVRRHIAGTLNAFESKTAVFDASGVTLTGQISQASWRWVAVSRFTSGSGLLLIWIGRSTAVVIPRRSFGNNRACEAAEAFIRARLREVRPA